LKVEYSNKMYKAPHKKLDKIPEDFPVLGSPKPVNKTWTKTFSSLATEWNKQTTEQEEEQKYRNEMQKELERREALNSNFGFVGEFRRTYYEGPIYRDYEEKPESVRDEWTLVDRTKYRPELSIEEKNEREIKREQDAQQKEEESVWKNEEWDVRDRRVIS